MQIQEKYQQKDRLQNLLINNKDPKAENYDWKND